MKKILLFGPEVTDFLNPLANKLKQLGYTVDLIENRKIPRNNINITESYSKILNYHDIVGKRISYADIIRYLLKKEFIKKFFKEIFINCLEGKCKIIQSIKNCLNNQLLKERFSLILNNYDIVNFHSLSPDTVSYVKYIRPEKKIILSFWGSDLFQISGIKNYYEQYEALQRADIITVQSYDMELTVLAKFGSELKSKIVVALFGINDEIFNRMDEFKKDIPDMNFLKNYNIPESKIKITIGYCGNPICNHLHIMEELEKVDQITKEKIHLLVPMTYGNYTKEYIDELKMQLNRAKITYTLFEKYLPYDDILKLRIYSDIMIMMNKSDALSQSVSEFIYGENLLINAIWLPYSPFRLQGVFLIESDFIKLCDTVSDAVNNYDSIKHKLTDNPHKVRKLTAFTQVWPKWDSILDSLVEKFNSVKN